MRRIVNDETLDILFRTAGVCRGWLARPVSDTMLRAVWELVRLGPSSGACRPVRVAFVKSETAKRLLAAALPEPERGAVATAPAVAIVACPAKDGDDGPSVRRDVMLREGALHAAYLMLAGRALGLDCAPIWHFDARLVDAEFFPDCRMTADFLCALGYGEAGPAASVDERPGFAEACAIL